MTLPTAGAQSTNTVSLGRAVSCQRLERGMRRKDLVLAAAVSYPHLAEIENGKKLPSMTVLARLAEALGTTPSGLLARAESITSDPRNGLTR